MAPPAGWSQWGVPPPPTSLSSSTWLGEGAGGGTRNPSLLCTQPVESANSPTLHTSALGWTSGAGVPCSFPPPPPQPHLPKPDSPKAEKAGVLLRARPWPAPRPAPREAPDAAPLAPTGGHWAPPAICSEMSFDPASRPAQQDFWHLGHRRQTRGMSYPRWWERRERRCLWDWACRAPSWLLAGAWSGEQVGGIKGRSAAPRRSQDASQPGWACCEPQMAASGSPRLSRVPGSLPGSSHLFGEEDRSRG